MHSILAVDDELSVRESYRMILGADYHVITAANIAGAWEALDKSHVDAILLDLTMPGESGMDLLAELHQRGIAIPVIVVTATDHVDTAVKAMKLGAREYVIKPFDVDEIQLLVTRVLAEQRDMLELATLREAGSLDMASLIGQAPAMQEVFEQARKAMRVDSTVLITGESGTGKELMARAIHAGGPRADKAFVPVCCCAIPDPLLESDLFGHEKGAFTGAMDKRVGKMQVADQGTLFLDEIGEMPLEAQAKLLRVLQERSFYPVGSTKMIEVDIRIVCATNRDLVKAVREGVFREDLFYRVNVLHLEMPPLRQRREDIPRLARHFIEKHRGRVNADTRELTPAACARLAAYEWPGNVRELENVIERLLVLHGTAQLLDASHLQDVLPVGLDPKGGAARDFEGLPLDEATRRLEVRLIERALERAGGVQSRAAELLGTTRRILKYKMDQLGLSSTQGSTE